MNCNVPDRQLLEYASADIEPEGREQLRKHIAQCPVCSERLVQFQGVFQLVKETSGPEPAAREWQHFERRLAQRLDDSRSRKWSGYWLKLRWMAPVTMAAAILIAALVTIPFGNQSTDQLAQELNLPENIDPSQVALLTDEIEQLLDADSTMMLENETADVDEWDPEIWPEDAPLNSFAQLIEEEYTTDTDELGGEHWTQQEAELFIKLYRETV